MMSEIHSIAIASVSDWIKQKKKICEAEGRSFQITSQKSSKKKEWQRMKKAYVNYEIPLGETTTYYWSPRGRSEGEGSRKLI